ncbi:isopentenyl-diphosphate Delta-isomerase [Nocardia sp. CC227C]|uniref:isopentenyl-diphosphate Delta-isomerase n=1 Tax=Nocardia sp. CC227C TaxID=3044562 RepID=UPI00278BE0B0|nr:isopentenyl-diphosphate Delta-isomerase [Nocardia sp. CC227C]
MTLESPGLGAATDREALPVELVDEHGRAIGACPVAEAHTAPGRLHRAFSVMLFDASGRMLVQQRAAVKTRFPLLWTNSCCGHPAPGQPVVEAAAVRLHEELGVAADLTEVGTFTYQATDPGTGRVEYEYDHVLIGRLDGFAPQPNPDEVENLAWLRPDRLRTALAHSPETHTPWLARVLDIADHAFRARG